jgi:hypothetical protein
LRILHLAVTKMVSGQIQIVHSYLLRCSLKHIKYGVNTTAYSSLLRNRATWRTG